MRKINEVLKILKDDLKNYNERNKELSKIVWDLKIEKAMLEKENEIYKRYFEKESDTELIKYKGKTYKIIARNLSSSDVECEQLTLVCR